MSTAFSLAPYVQVLYLGENLHVGFGAAGLVFKEKEEKAAVFRILEHTSDAERLSAFIDGLPPGSTEERIVEVMVRNRLLVPADHVPGRGRHHREQLYFLLSGGVAAEVTRRLADKQVAIIGCGGIGCLMAFTLLTAGVTRMLLVDDDVVEIHNISRQFAYTEADLGKKKVHILKEQLLERYGSAEILALDQRAVFGNEGCNIPMSDFVVLAADEPGILGRANASLVKHRVPFIHVSYVNEIAAWGPLVDPGKTGCYACQKHVGVGQSVDAQETAVMQRINSSYTCPVVSSVSTTAVALASLDVLRFLGEFGQPATLNKRIGLWTHDLHFEEQNYDRSEHCAVCSDGLDAS